MIKKIIFIYFIAIFLNSCSVIKKNQYNREELYAVKLAKKNGNSFYIFYNPNYSIVWSYVNNLLYIYEFEKGRRKKYVYNIEKSNWIYNFDLEKLIKNYCDAIDAQYIAQYEYKGKLLHKGFSINIFCLGKKINEFSGINKKFVKDMKKYHIILLTQKDIDSIKRAGQNTH